MNLRMFVLVAGTTMLLWAEIPALAAPALNLALTTPPQSLFPGLLLAPKGSTNIGPRELFLLQTNRQPFRIAEGRARRAPAPGVYKTEPYTCIVVVPGPIPDDKMIAGSQGNRQSPAIGPQIPSISPELRFIPWGQQPRTNK